MSDIIKRMQKAAQEIAVKYDIKNIELETKQDSSKDDSEINIFVEFNREAVSLFEISGIKADSEDALDQEVYVYHAPLKDETDFPDLKAIRIFQ